MLNSIDRDGMMSGYDLKLNKQISNNLDIPIISCGGAGNFGHLVELFSKTNVSAAACSSIFHFGDTVLYAGKNLFKKSWDRNENNQINYCFLSVHFLNNML